MKKHLNYNQILSTEEGLPPSQKKWKQTFASFKNKNFRYYFFGQGCSLIGTWMRSAALGWITYQISHSAFLLGLVFTLNTLPVPFIAPWAGTLADQFSKIKIFQITSVFSMISSLTITVLLFISRPSILELMIFSLLWGCSSAFEMPARQALVIDLVKSDEMVNAVALNSSLINFTRIIGPALAGILIGSIGAAWCFLIDAISFIIILIVLSKLKNIPNSSSLKRTPVLKQLKEVVHYVKRTPIISRNLLILATMSIFGWAYFSQLPAIAKTQLHMGAEGYGWLLAMTGLGASMAGLTVATLSKHPKIELQSYIGIIIFCLSIIAFGFQKNLVASAFFLFLSGYGLILFFSTNNSLIQLSVSNEFRGRVTGLRATAFGGGMPIGSFWMGIVASKIGSTLTLQISAALALIFSIYIFSHFIKKAF